MKDHNTIGMPPFTRLLRIERVDGGWRCWTGTKDFRVGNYLLLMDNGEARNVTTRVDEGDEMFIIRPRDSEPKESNDE